MRCSCGVLTLWLHTAAGGSRRRATDMKWGNDAPINSYWMEPLKHLQSCQATGNCRDSDLISNEHFIMVCIQTMLSIHLKSTWKYSLPKNVNSIIIYSPSRCFRPALLSVFCKAHKKDILKNVNGVQYFWIQNVLSKSFFQRKESHAFEGRIFILGELSLWGTNSCFHKVSLILNVIQFILTLMLSFWLWKCVSADMMICYSCHVANDRVANRRPSIFDDSEKKLKMTNNALSYLKMLLVLAVTNASSQSVQ